MCAVENVTMIDKTRRYLLREFVISQMVRTIECIPEFQHRNFIIQNIDENIVFTLMKAAILRPKHQYFV